MLFKKEIVTPSPYATYTYKFKNQGTYVPVLEVVDADGVTLTKNIQAVFVIDFKADFSALSSYTIKKSQGFQTTVSATGGQANYVYRFGYKKDGKKTYVYSSDRVGTPYMTYTYKFSEAGSYVPFVEIMDGNNLYASATLNTVTVKN